MCEECLKCVTGNITIGPGLFLLLAKPKMYSGSGFIRWYAYALNSKNELCMIQKWIRSKGDEIRLPEMNYPVHFYVSHLERNEKKSSYTILSNEETKCKIKRKLNVEIRAVYLTR